MVSRIIATICATIRVMYAVRSIPPSNYKSPLLDTQEIMLLPQESEERDIATPEVSKPTIDLQCA